MKELNFHSKLRILQGQNISENEGRQFLSQLKGIFKLKEFGQITENEAGTLVRKAAWKIAEDLRLNNLDLSSGTTEELLIALPKLLSRYISRSYDFKSS